MKTELDLEREKEAKERAIYGRYWIWEGYFNDKKKDLWLETAEMLKHVNPHVLQDIEDFILLEGFKGIKSDKIRTEIEEDQRNRIAEERKLRGPDGEEYEEMANKQASKRRVLLPLRPTDNNKVWNFFEDCDEDLKTPHVLRFNANPEKAYEDGRI